MYRSLQVISLVWFSATLVNCGFPHKKFGCLLAPNICTPPEGCSDDGLIGNCQVPYASRNWRPVNDEVPFVGILRTLEERGYELDYKTIRDALYASYFGQPDYEIDPHIIGLSKLLAELEHARYAPFSSMETVPSAGGHEQQTNDDLHREKLQEYRRSAPEYDKTSWHVNQQKKAEMIQLVKRAEALLRKKGIKLSDLSDRQIDELATILAEELIRNNEKAKTEDNKGNAEPAEGWHMSDTRENELSEKGKSRDDLLPASDGNEEIVYSQPASLEDTENDSVNAGYAESVDPQVKPKTGNTTLYIVIIVVGVTVLLVILVTVITCCIRVYWDKKDEKVMGEISAGSPKPLGEDYQELCRQHYASKNSEQTENRTLVVDDHAIKEPLITQTYPISRPSDTDEVAAAHLQDQGQEKAALDTTRNSSVSSTSWSEEPVTASLDITTGHAVLSYMEDHLNNKDRLDEEWEGICTYEADRTTTSVATNPQNSRKNRAVAALPYDHNRVRLDPDKNHLQSDYVNASMIIDNDPKRPLYIATQGPLASTIPDFWQMMWEQGCVAIVMLTPLVEEGVNQCARYWPDEGSCTYHKFEIHLVSEHIWCEDYLVRSLYLKNLETGGTRTVTQFHFLSWPNNRIPPTPKPLLELRRKVTKCYKGHNSPVLVHCSDGTGRSGTYILLDLAIDRMLKGAKEIDISATLEHIRDQRAGMVSTKEQFEFALTAVAEEVNAILKSLLH